MSEAQLNNYENVIAAFRRRLAETAAWCAPRASLSDPARCLRTPELRPPHYEPWTPEEPAAAYEGRYKWGMPNAARLVVENLAQRRADLLGVENAYPTAANAPRHDGKVVVLHPQESGDYGLTADATGFYIDNADVFPWDTWVWCDCNATLDHNGYMDLTLFCWVPALFVSAVEEAMLVDPHECFYWMNDYARLGSPTPFRSLWTDAALLSASPPDAV